MNDATTDRNKRLRFDTSVRSPDDEAVTPLAAAKKTLATHCASLQPQIASLLLRLGQQHLSYLHRIWSKQRQISKLENDEQFIPRSARVQFVLTSSKLAEKDEEYLRLRDDTAILVLNFQKELKRKIVSTSKLESRLTKVKLRSDFVSAIRVSIQAFIIVDPALDSKNCDQIANTILDRYFNPLLSHLDISLEDFRLLYRQHHTIAQLPAPYPDTLHSTGSNAQTAPSAVCHSISKINRALCDVFISPWTKFLTVQKRMDMDIALQALTVSHFDTSATDEANMIVDNEPPADPPQIKDLIQQQVSKETAKLQQEIQRLRAQVQSTDHKRQSTPSSSSSKNVARDRTRKGPNQQNKSGAGDSNKDSNVAKTNKSRKTRSRHSSSNESKKKNTNSSRNNNTRSNQSNTNSN